MNYPQKDRGAVVSSSWDTTVSIVCPLVLEIRAGSAVLSPLPPAPHPSTFTAQTHHGTCLMEGTLPSGTVAITPLCGVPEISWGHY